MKPIRILVTEMFLSSEPVEFYKSLTEEVKHILSKTLWEVKVDDNLAPKRILIPMIISLMEEGKKVKANYLVPGIKPPKEISKVKQEIEVKTKRRPTTRKASKESETGTEPKQETETVEEGTDVKKSASEDAPPSGIRKRRRAPRTRKE